MDTAAAAGTVGLTEVLMTAGYDVLIAVVDGPDYDALSNDRGHR
jgi:hypothetical protein